MLSKINEDVRILGQLKNAVVLFDMDEMDTAVLACIEANMDPHTAIFNGLVPGIEEVGRLYNEEVYFIPEMLMCTEVLYHGLELLKPRVARKKLGFTGVVIIGVVEGDIHDVGKNIVKIMLEVSGFEVYDLGKDVPVENFLNEYKRLKPDLVCLSAMMTTAIPEMKKVIKGLKKRNPNVVILVGGAPINEHLAARWGANAYAQNAHLAMKAALKMLKTIEELKLSEQL